MRRLGALLTTGLLATLLTQPAAAASAPAPAPAAKAATDRPAVIAKRVIGTSVRGRPIVAWHLGEPDAPRVRTVVLISTMHGDEPATRRILETLRDGAPVHDLDLWVVPTYNPDGLARGTRKNARGIDLNRNYPYSWRDLDGSYESGPRPASEPETRAMMRFLSDVRPDRVLSFHQPLLGVDTDTKRPEFARRVARKLHLPRRSLTCGGVCHGTMTGWFNHSFKGAALTVEYGARPSRRRMTREAPGQVLSVFGAYRGPRSLEPL
ncbi:MAG: M14 family zinc carboxypeptidase [Nocardioides sp.]